MARILQIQRQDLHPLAIASLLEAGWSEGRTVDIRLDTVLRHILGAMPKAIASMVKNVAGLNVRSSIGWIGFDPCSAANYFDQEDFKLIARRSSQAWLSPLGVSSCSYLLVGELGRVVYVDCDFHFLTVLTSITTACNWILAGDHQGVQASIELSIAERPSDLR